MSSADRDTPNWISALLAAAYVVVYLAAPFYQMAHLPVPLNGIRLIGFNALAILPVLLGTVMAIGACMFPPLIAVITDGVTLLATLVCMLLGNSFVASLTVSSANLSADWTVPIQSVVTSIATVVPGWGAIVCMVLCVAALVVDIVANQSPKNQGGEQIIDPPIDPFGSSPF